LANGGESLASTCHRVAAFRIALTGYDKPSDGLTLVPSVRFFQELRAGQWSAPALA